MSKGKKIIEIVENVVEIIEDVKEIVTEVKEVISHFKGYKTFKSNGKSKHMPKDSEFQVTHETASLFLSKNYGKLID